MKYVVIQHITALIWQPAVFNSAVFASVTEVGEDLRRPRTLAVWRGGATGFDRVNVQAVSVG